MYQCQTVWDGNQIRVKAVSKGKQQITLAGKGLTVLSDDNRPNKTSANCLKL